MRLAEALIERASLQKKFNELQSRILSNVTVQEGETPSEDPEELIAIALDVVSKLRKIIQDINRTNSQSMFIEGVTLTDTIAARDSLKAEHQMYERIATGATVNNTRYSRTEIKSTSIVNVAEYRKKADATAAKYRALDTQIQEFNWKIDLIE